MYHIGKWRISAANTRGIYFAGLNCDFCPMIELIRTNDHFVLSRMQSLLRDVGIRCFIVRQNMGALDGLLGIMLQRIVIDENDINEVQPWLAEAGIENAICQ